MAVCSGPFFREIARRKKQGRDAQITISARDGETGVGKTSLAVFLAKYLHTANVPFDPETMATLSVEEFNARYEMNPRGSSLILDEAEQLDARRSNSNKNVDTAELFQMRRIDEIVSILTLPSVAELDRRIERLHNYWINVTARGVANVYKAKVHDHTKNIYYIGLQQIEWPNMDPDPAKQALDRKKDEFLEGTGTADWVRKAEIEEEYEKKVEEAQQEMRDKIIRSVYSKTDLSQSDLGSALPNGGLSQQQVGNITRG